MTILAAGLASIFLFVLIALVYLLLVALAAVASRQRAAAQERTALDAIAAQRFQAERDLAAISRAHRQAVADLARQHARTRIERFSDAND